MNLDMLVKAVNVSFTLTTFAFMRNLEQYRRENSRVNFTGQDGPYIYQVFSKEKWWLLPLWTFAINLASGRNAYSL